MEETLPSICLGIAGYYIPWVDHSLDTIATPAVIIAGTLVTASIVTGMSPILKWTLAIVAGGSRNFRRLVVMV